MTSSVVGPRRSSRALPKVTLAPEKGHGHVAGLLPIWSTTAFWIPGKPFHLRSMLSKLMRHTENCNTCRWYWSTEWAQFFSATTPDHTVHNQRFRSWMNWATKFHLIHHFAWRITDWLPLLQASWKLSAGKTFSQPSGGRKRFPRVHQILKHGFFFFVCLLYFFLAKMCWLWWFLVGLIMVCLSLVIVT